MIEAVITTLITICVLAVAIYLILWVIQSVAGITLPDKVTQIIWIIFVLICVLLLVRLLLPHMGKLVGMLPMLV